MSDLNELYFALAKADAEGDTESVDKLTDYIHQLDASQREQRRASLIAQNPTELDPSSQQYQDRYGATAGNSFGRNMVIGAGKMATDIGLGAQQIVGMAPAEAAADKRALDSSIMRTGGGKVGYGVGGIAAAVPLAMSAGATVPGAALAGGVFGALQPAESMGERYLNAGTGAGYGAAGQYGFGRLTSRLGSYETTVQPGTAGIAGGGRPVPMGNRVSVPEGFTRLDPAVRASYGMTPEEAAAAESNAAGFGSASGRSGASASVSGTPTANVRIQSANTPPEMGTDPSAGLNASQARALKVGESLGFRVTPGVKSGSKVLQQREAAMESRPWSSGPFFEIKDANLKTGNRIVAKAIGAKSDVVDTMVLLRTDSRIGKVYDAVADDRVRAVNQDEFLTQLAGIEEDATGLLQNNMSVGEHPLVRQLFDLVAGGKVTGKQAQNLSSKLGRAVKTNLTSASGDRELGLALLKVKDMADDVLAQGLDENMAARFKVARGEYRILKLLESANVTNTSNGNVSLANLGNLLARVDKKGFMYGKNQSDLYNAARFAQAFRPLVGDSGTATRSAGGTTIADIALGFPVNLATRVYTSNAVTSAAGAAAGARSATRGVVDPVVDPFISAVGKYSTKATPYAIPGGANALYELTRKRQ
jgi:hypothetical protein